MKDYFIELKQRKKLFFYVLLILGVCLFLESFSSFILMIHPKGRLPLSEIMKEVKDVDFNAAISQEVPHPYLGYVYNPEFNAVLKGPEYVSEFGFRGHETPIRKRSAGRLIIGITGGSVAEFFSVDGAQALIKTLKRDPQFSDKEFDIISLAVGGYKQPQQLMVLNYLLSLGAEFDFFINLDGFNEIALPPVENVPVNVFPVFPRDWFHRTHFFYDSKSLNARTKSFILTSLLEKLVCFLSKPPMKYSATLKLFGELAKRILMDRIYRCREEILRGRDASALQYVTSGPSFKSWSGDKLYDELSNVWMRSSLVMNQIAAAEGIRYFHFLQPNQYVKDSKPMGPEERRQAYTDDEAYRYSVEKGYALEIEKGKELMLLGVHFFDLTGIFKEDSKPRYIDNCCHISVAANQLLGAEMGRLILESLRREREASREKSLVSAGGVR